MTMITSGCADARERDPIAAIDIRPVIDGPGPSNLITIGRYLLVFDPWSFTIRRYDATDLSTAPRVCLYPRGFSPWRINRRGDGVRVAGEPHGPNDKGAGYDYRVRAVMIIDAAAVAAMPLAGPCRFSIGAYDPRLDAAPASRPVDGGARPGWLAGQPLIRPQQAGARIFAIRPAGRLADGRDLVWWSEIGGPAGGIGGRLSAAQYVGVVDRGRLTGTIRIAAAAYPLLAPDTASPPPTILSKPGFDDVAGDTVGGRNIMWVMAAADTPSGKHFAVRGYLLDELIRDGPTTLTLVRPGAPTLDRNDAPVEDDAAPPATTRFAGAVTREQWFDRARSTLRAQIAVRWRYPAGAALVPCGGADRCTVGADETGVIGVGPAFEGVVTDRIATAGGAIWMRPRPLAGLMPGDRLRGVPYSIGGNDLADDFLRRLTADYTLPSSRSAPIGHIREGMEWSNSDGHYPLGIDCSALVARVFDLRNRATAVMVRTVGYTTPSGRHYQLPRGPRGACPQPVRRFDDLRPGDVLVRDGHIVIFAGLAARSAETGLVAGMRVFESSSRCGAVCESVYDPSYFDGWWMVRIARGDGRDCPRWLDTADKP